MENVYWVKSPALNCFKKNDGRVIIFNRVTSKSHIVSCKAYEVLEALDGEKSISDLKLCFEDFTYDEIVELIRGFSSLGLCTNNINDTYISNFSFLYSHGRFIIFKEPEKLFLFKSKIIMNFFRVVLLISPLACILELYFLYDIINIEDLTLNFNIAVLSIFVFLISLSLHEISHAIFAKIHGANIAEFGVQLQLSFCFIRFYTNICGISYIRKKRYLVEVHLAGILTNFFMMDLSFIFIYTKVSFLSEMGIIFFLINFLCMLIDSFPLNGSDGYKALILIFKNKR